MIALIAFLACSAPPKLPSWDKVIHDMAPQMSRVARPNQSVETREKIVNRALARLGCLAKRSKNGHQHGYLASYVYGSVVVEGAKDWVIVPIERYGETSPPIDSEFRWILFIREGSSMVGRKLALARDACPESTISLGNKLIIAGKDNLNTNMPQAMFACFEKQRSGWKLLRYKNTWNDVYEIPKLRLSKDGKSIQPLTVTVHSYPVNINMCHADAQILVDLRWTFPSGLPSCKSEIVRDTPLNAMDDLVKAIRDRSWDGVRAKSRTTKIARKLALLYKAMKSKEEYGYYRPDGMIVRDGKDPEFSRDFVLTDLSIGCRFNRYRGRWVVAKLMPYEEETE